MSVLSLALALALVLAANACTTVHVTVDPKSTGPDAGTTVLGRTMEIGFRALLPYWDIVVVPRRSPEFRKFFTGFTEGTSKAKLPHSCPYLPNTTSNSVGFVAINVPVTLSRLPIGSLNFVFEGQNEHGLTISAQILQLSQYQFWNNTQCPSDDGKYRLSWVDFVPYLLGSFSNAPDAIQALRDKIVVTRPQVLKCEGGTGFHWTVDDAMGNHFIVEYLGNQLVVQKSKLGVFTNDPDFSWHVQHLNFFGNLRAEIPTIPTERQFPLPSNMRPKQINTVVPDKSSHGTGFLGLPGDYSPPSRFVKMFYLRGFSQANAPPPDLNEALALTSILLDTVAIPYGNVNPPAPRCGEDENTCGDLFTLRELVRDNELTQWTVLKIPSKGLFYYKNYLNPAWKKIDLHELNFSEGAPVLSTKVYNPLDPFGSPAVLMPQGE